MHSAKYRQSGHFPPFRIIKQLLDFTQKEKRKN
jgi:hypothetical protein